MYIVIGASGFIGRHIMMECERQSIRCIGTYNEHSCGQSKMYHFDMLRQNPVEFLRELLTTAGEMESENYLIVCAANASIDSCKKNLEKSRALNIDATKQLVDAGMNLHCKIVFLSSEAVFDGSRGIPDERAHTSPITEYGRQKVIIEEYLREKTEDYLIVRISRAVGDDWSEGDIFRDFFDKIRANKPIECLKNQSFNPTAVKDIARSILLACENKLQGIYHVANPEYISRYQLARMYAECIFGGYDKIYEKEYEEMNFLDKRHIYSGLNGQKLMDALPVEFLNLRQIMNNYKKTVPYIY